MAVKEEVASVCSNLVVKTLYFDTLLISLEMKSGTFNVFASVMGSHFAFAHKALIGPVCGTWKWLKP